MLNIAKIMAYSCILLLCCFSSLWSKDEIIYFQNYTGVDSSDEWQFKITGGINRNWKSTTLKGFQSSLNITELQKTVGPIVEDNVTGIEISVPSGAPQKICSVPGENEITMDPRLRNVKQICQTTQPQAVGCLTRTAVAGCVVLKAGQAYILGIRPDKPFALAITPKAS